MDDQRQYQQKMGSLEDALALLRSNDVIACAAVVNEPTDFLKALPSVLPGLNNITLFKGKENYYDYLADLTYQKNIHTVSYLFGDNTRAAQKVGMASYIPTDLSTLCANRTAVAPNNVFVAQVTEMDEIGCFQRVDT